MSSGGAKSRIPFRLVDDLEKRRRARAAAGYSLKTHQALAKEAGIKYDRLRSVLGPNGRHAPTLEELQALVKAAGLPQSFAGDGQPEPSDDVVRDITDLRASIAWLTAQLGRQEQAIRELRGRNHRGQREEDERR